MASFDLDHYRRSWQPLVDGGLAGILTELSKLPEVPQPLARAMAHALLGGGKRLRPLLCILACRVCGGEEDAALYPACALELIHAYSLVHDDLPAMDDDDFRRGRPSCHRAFGEALAILAGDALLTHAFYVLAQSVPAPAVAPAVVLIAKAAGPAGMVGGQADDIAAGALEIEQVEFIHRRKTAAMFAAAAELGGLVAGAAAESLRALSAYGWALGLAYQIADDLLSLEGDEAVLGRPPGSDRGKRTHPVLAGARASRERITALLGEAAAALLPLGPGAEALEAMARLVQERAGQIPLEISSS